MKGIFILFKGQAPGFLWEDVYALIFYDCFTGAWLRSSYFLENIQENEQACCSIPAQALY